MAAQLLNTIKTFQALTISTRCRLGANLVQREAPKAVLFVNQTRNTNFFNRLPADSLWKGITSVSNAGRKRGRAKNVSKKLIKDLNKGQVLGVGKANIVWPGLNAPIIKGKELIEQRQLPEDTEREQKLIEMRNKMGTIRFAKINPLDRGWSGAKMPGRSIGAPDPIGEDKFDGFDTKVLEYKLVFNMKGNFGRTRRLSVLCVTGNGKGLAGFAIGKAVDPRGAMRKSKNRAGQKLMHIKLHEDRTVYHDFFTQFGATKIFVSQRPEGYGLVCHRAIKTICEVVGIKDLHAKVEGSTNLQHVVKAFFLGLLRQKTHQEIVEEKKLHLVELRPENSYFPRVLASPKECRNSEDITHDEIMDLSQYTLDGRVILKRKKFPPFFAKSKGYEIYLKKQEKMRNHDKVRRYMIAEYGEIRSFLTDKYPECRPPAPKPKENKEEEEESAASESTNN